jgi:hypothetical protein
LVTPCICLKLKLKTTKVNLQQVKGRKI